MASLRKAAQCVGLSGPFSVNRDFFGYWSRVPTTLSLLKQIRLLQGKHIHLNLIRTAFFNDTQIAQIDAAVQFVRDSFASVNVGVGRVSRFFVNQGGYEIIMAEDVALDLWDSWSVPNDGIDAFLCYYLNGAASGRSAEPGSCDKSGKDSGLVVGVLDNPNTLGLALAHEIGHFLGLAHEDDLPNNLMYPSVPNGGQLYGGQGGAMRLHCSMRASCQT